MSGLWHLMAVWNAVRLELLIDGACERQELLQLNKDTVAKFCFMLACYLWGGTGVHREIIISVRECHFGYVHTVSDWDWQAYMLTDVSQMWIVPLHSYSNIQKLTECGMYQWQYIYFFFCSSKCIHFFKSAWKNAFHTCNDLKLYFICICFYGGQVSSTCCNFRKHMQMEKAPSSIWQQVLQMLTTQPNK